MLHRTTNAIHQTFPMMTFVVISTEALSIKHSWKYKKHKLTAKLRGTTIWPKSYFFVNQYLLFLELFDHLIQTRNASNLGMIEYKYKKRDFYSVHYFSAWHFKIFIIIDKWMPRFFLRFQVHTRNCNHQYTNMPNFFGKYYWWYSTIYFNRMRWKTYDCYCSNFYRFYPTLVLLLLVSDKKQWNQSKLCHKSLNFIPHKQKTV